VVLWLCVVGGSVDLASSASCKVSHSGNKLDKTNDMWGQVI
jgi:hypothetical protein